MDNSKIRGILLVLGIGLVVLVMSKYITFVNLIIIGLFTGIILGNFLTIPKSYNDGISYSSAKMLELSIIFLAFSINMANIAKLGWGSLLIIFVIIFAVLLLTLGMARYFNCPRSVGWLVGFGTAICGSSAIAALAPSIKENKEDIGVAISVVNLYGFLGMVALPVILMYLGWDEKAMSMILGGSLHAVGNVAGAGYAISDAVGEGALTIKLARVALLGPALVFFNYFINPEPGKGVWKVFTLPWYVWGFILISVLVSLVSMPGEILKYASETGKILLTFAMIAIGIKVKIKDLIVSGQKGLMFGLVIFILQLIILFTLTKLFL